MKIIILLLISVPLVISCNSPKEKPKEISIVEHEENTLSDKEMKEGWELLFDGKSLKGWRGIGISSIPKGHWRIEDHCIQKIKSGDIPSLADGQPLKGGDLMTDQTFDNFELSFDWKISKAGNSGVKYNVIEEVSVKNKSTSALGYEYQIIDEKGYKGDLKPSQRTASLYDIIEAVGAIAKPVGEFNTSRIIFNGIHGEHWLNGVKVVEYNLDDPSFKTMFEKSKYHAYDNFINHKVAHIILQDHGNDCWYKNIKIRKLK